MNLSTLIHGSLLVRNTCKLVPCLCNSYRASLPQVLQIAVTANKQGVKHDLHGATSGATIPDLINLEPWQTAQAENWIWLQQ